MKRIKKTLKAVLFRFAAVLNPRDNHFNVAGHALFAKFVTDTDEARASVDYYTHQ